MNVFSSLENEVLRTIATQASNSADILIHQIGIAQVVSRENTGAGFFTTLAVETDRLASDLPSPVGCVEATIRGLNFGMGFLLWLKGGLIHTLEGYSYEEDTSTLEFEGVEFQAVRAVTLNRT